MLVVWAAAFLCLPVLSWAQGKTLPLGEVCVVSMQRVVEGSRIGKAATSSLEADMQKSKSRVEGLKAETEELRENLRKQSAILSAEALESRTLTLQRKERELGVALAEMRQEFLRKNNESVAKVMKQTNSALKELNQEHKCRFVLERGEQFVVYASSRVDLTEDLIKMLDKN